MEILGCASRFRVALTTTVGCEKLVLRIPTKGKDTVETFHCSKVNVRMGKKKLDKRIVYHDPRSVVQSFRIDLLAILTGAQPNDTMILDGFRIVS